MNDNEEPPRGSSGHETSQEIKGRDVESVMTSASQQGQAKENNLVDWDSIDDKEDVKQMSNTRKWLITILLTVSALNFTALSSMWSTVSASIQKEFGSSFEVTVLGISLFMVCLASGPLLIAPLSEFYGRKPLYTISYLIYFATQFITAFGKNIGTLLVGRALSGFFGSVFLSNTPGTISDIFYPHQLTLPMTLFTIGPFVGPGLGPVISGFIVASVGYKWTFYVFLIWSGVLLIAVFFLVPETYAPILKVKKAKRLRKTTGNEKLYAEFERKDKNILRAVRTNCTRPFLLLALDPMILLLCFYSGFLLAIVYFFFIAFPLVFEDVYGFKIQFVGLSFLGVTVGMIIGSLTAPIWHRIHQSLIEKNKGVPEPEMRLPQLCCGGLIIPIGLFFFAWTIYPSVHWMAPIVAGGIFGLGCYLAFNTILSYLVDAYRQYAASTMAANVSVRCFMAAAFPLFGKQMLYGMTFHWAISFIGFISILLCPSGFLFFKYGKFLRSKSKFASI
jgi:multidrug resistance protein